MDHLKTRDELIIVMNSMKLNKKGFSIRVISKHKSNYKHFYYFTPSLYTLVKFYVQLLAAAFAINDHCLPHKNWLSIAVIHSVFIGKNTQIFG